MKMSAEKYTEIKEGIRQIVDHHGKENVQSLYKSMSLTRMMWDLFSALWFDFQYGDTHPAYAKGHVRILPYKDHAWLNNLYKSGLNDTHIETALKRIAKEIGLAPDTAG